MDRERSEAFGRGATTLLRTDENCCLERTSSRLDRFPSGNSVADALDAAGLSAAGGNMVDTSIMWVFNPPGHGITRAMPQASRSKIRLTARFLVGLSGNGKRVGKVYCGTRQKLPWHRHQEVSHGGVSNCSVNRAARSGRTAARIAPADFSLRIRSNSIAFRSGMRSRLAAASSGGIAS